MEGPDFWQRLSALISTLSCFLAEFTGNKTFFFLSPFFELLTLCVRQYIISKI
jgi:hypothetical protein